jgi:glutaredoxin
MKLFLHVFYLLSPLLLIAQTPAVELIEDKQPKRWTLYAQNNTAIEQEAFLMVNGEGFRRSADRPIIKKIPPNSKVVMIILIPLKGATPSYTKIFTFEEQLQTIKKRKGEGQKEHVNLLPVNPEQLTIFTENDCEKCTHLTNYLNRKRIKYRTLNIKKNSAVFNLMWSHLKDSVSGRELIKLPVLMHKETMYFDIISMKHFIQNFDWEKIE